MNDSPNPQISREKIKIFASRKRESANRHMETAVQMLFEAKP